VVVSKAFTREDDAELPLIVAPRAPLPDGVPNYVTAQGLARLHRELAELGTEREDAERSLDEATRARALAAIGARRAALESRIASAELVPAPHDCDEVRFGATVVIESEAGLRQYTIVGVDEADATRGKIAFVSPLARALLGRSVGHIVELRKPGGLETLKIESVRYEPG
jgi:transcription elongation factor GreB